MIDVNSRVAVRVLGGELTGTVTEVKHTTLAELNIQAPVNPNKPVPTIQNTPVNTQRPIILYTVEIDNTPEYSGENPLRTYAFIREIT